jgi:hypothetical protein
MPAASEDFVSEIGSVIDETKAVPFSAAPALGVLNLLLSRP